MTKLADLVVADSSYLLEVVRKHTDAAQWIPDNVDTRLFRGSRRHRSRRRPLRLAWSGMAHKADHLLAIRDVLASARDVELVVVSNRRPGAIDELARVRFVPFELRRYPRVLRGCDVIVSPKRLDNGYELGHTEWKITLGMAVGLPAIASPQRSYVEAIEHEGGGIVAADQAGWRDALERLRDDPPYRAELGERARRTVHERYSTPVVARQYLELIESLA